MSKPTTVVMTHRQYLAAFNKADKIERVISLALNGHPSRSRLMDYTVSQLRAAHRFLLELTSAFDQSDDNAPRTRCDIENVSMVVRVSSAIATFDRGALMDVNQQELHDLIGKTAADLLTKMLAAK